MVFALIWIAWINGSLYLELHGREDGRTRSIVFVQMGILVLLAVFTADAASGSGRGLRQVSYQVLQTGLWSSVWRQDRRERPEFLANGAMWSAWGCRRTVIGASACWRPPHMLVWAGLGWPGSSAPWPPAAPWPAWARPPPTRWSSALDCLSSSSSARSCSGSWPACRWPNVTPPRLSPGCWRCGWVSGSGGSILIWWAGGCHGANRVALANWVMSHLPIARAITAAGAGMVNLIGPCPRREDAGSHELAAGRGRSHRPGGPGRRRAGPGRRRAAVGGVLPLGSALCGGAAAALLVGWLRPAPWLLALGLVAVLSVVWSFAVSRFLRADAWGQPRPARSRGGARTASNPPAARPHIAHSTVSLRGHSPADQR